MTVMHKRSPLHQKRLIQHWTCQISVGVLNQVLENIALRAQNGATQSRLSFARMRQYR